MDNDKAMLERKVDTALETRTRDNQDPIRVELKYVCSYDKNYGMNVELYPKTVDITCWGLLHMTDEQLSHELTRNEAIAMACEILNYYRRQHRRG